MEISSPTPCTLSTSISTTCVLTSLIYPGTGTLNRLSTKSVSELICPAHLATYFLPVTSHFSLAYAIAEHTESVSGFL